MKTPSEKPLMTKDAKTISLRHWLDYIQSLHDKVVDFDLARPRLVAQRGGFDKLGVPAVTVAGTNGKGSTVALMAKLLSACGLRVGCYFSPHLNYFNERIVINGKVAPEHIICHAFAKVEEMRQETTLTYFEFTTLAAFEIFKNSALDIVILEVGCGGEKDAVNLIDPSLSIITNISMDHTDLLGDDIESIALAKAGILRKDVPAIIGLKAQKPVVLEKAKNLKAKLYLEGQAFGWHDKYKSYWQYKGHYIKVPSTFVPSSSISLSFAACEILKSTLPQIKSLPFNRLSHILKCAQLPGRFQRIMARADIILDVAHNEAGSQWLVDNLKKLPPAPKTIAVWSSFKDKDLKSIIQPLKGIIDEWIISPMKHERSATIEELQQALHELGETNIVIHTALSKAFQEAERQCEKNDRIVVFGSFGTVGEVMRVLEHDYQSTNVFYTTQLADIDSIES